MSDWIKVLRGECTRVGRKRVSIIINYSETVISQVLNGKYPGDLKRVEEKVKGALMGATVDCPVVGEMPRNRCIDHQRRAGSFAATNPTRVQLSQTCPTCQHKE